MPAPDAGPATLASVMKLVERHLASASLDELGAAVEKDDTQACRIRSGQANVSILDAVRMLYAAGVKCVPLGHVCVERGTYEAMTLIASKAMANVGIARQLVWSDESQ